jgi:hypothetical protein
MRSKSPAIGALVMVAVAVGCSQPPSASPASGGPRMLAVGPLSYFQAHCARCHGPYGSFFALPFKSSTADMLNAKIEEMARGPGGSPLDTDGVAAQASFHRSLSRGGVFLSVTGVIDGLIHGEVTVGAEVVVVGPSGPVAAAVEGHRWRCPAGGPSGHWKVEARLGGKSAVVDPWHEAFGCSE